jgi:hypothetical protein
VPLLPSALVLSLRGETPFLRSTLVITQSIGFVLILRNKYANFFGGGDFMSLLTDLKEIKGQENFLAS